MTSSLDSLPCGRFAPTPSGPLHFGSLVTAVASFLHAKSRAGRWLVRIEDVDTTRVEPESASTILRQLEAAGLCWDGEIEYQSKRIFIYEKALAELRKLGVVFDCCCTRRQLQDVGKRSIDGAPFYPGTCRAGRQTETSANSVRLRVPSGNIFWTDTIQGPQHQDLAKDVGDFVIRRADGCFAYHLAVVVDDELQGVTDVVRGADLLDSTPRQIFLQKCLGYRTLRYTHLPLALNQDGEKLSKQTRSPAVLGQKIALEVYRCLTFLGQNPIKDLKGEAPAVVLTWALQNWREDLIPHVLGQVVD